ncbi:MAG TPA: tetratricopeptide repeat protein [Longimicrobiaceae bacterium]|jgi:tetratricopeptide (TPR) repeat protein
MTDATDLGEENRQPASSGGDLPSRDNVVREVVGIRTRHAAGVEDREHELRRLRQTLLNRRGRFAMLFAVCNDRVLQRKLTRDLFSRVPNLTPVELEITGEEYEVLEALSSSPGAPDPLVVYGIERLLPSSDEGQDRRVRTLVELQHRRDLFATLERPVLLWMPEYVFSMLGHEAVDFWSWRTATFFFGDQPAAPHVSEMRGAATLPPIVSTGRTFLAPAVVGREREMKAVLEALQEGGHVVIVGSGGVGKTYMARLVAREADHLFPDGTIFVSLQADAGKRDAAAGLREIIRTLAPAAESPVGDVRLYAVYRDLLQGKRALVVVDDVPDEKTARLFLPPPKCQLLLTSRVQLKLPGATVITVGALDREEAVHMLQTLVPRVSAGDGRMLADCFGGDPLSLRLAAGILNADDSLRTTDFINALQREWVERSRPGQNPPATSRLLDALFPDLTPGEMRVLGVISVFPRDFSSEAAAAVCGGDVGAVLTRLQLYGLLAEEQPDRYRIPALVRDYVRAKVEASDLEAAERRHSQYFCELLERAESIYPRGGSAPEVGVRLFEAEWTNIRQGQSWAASHANHDEDAAILCVNYALAAPHLTRVRLPAQTRLEWLEAALSVEKRRSASGVLGVLLLEAAELHRKLGAPDRAAEYEREAGEWYSRLLASATERGDLQAQAHASEALAARAVANRDFATAVERYATLALAAHAAEAPALEAYAYQMRGEVELARGNLDSAEEWYLKALATLQDSGNSPTALAQCFAGLSDLAAMRRDWDGAEIWALKALELQETLGDRLAVGARYRQLGNAARHQGEFESAERWFRRALEIQELLGDRPQIAHLLHELGDVITKLGRVDEGTSLLLRSLREYESLGDLHGSAVAVFVLGVSALRNGELQTAESWFRRALDTAERIGDRRMVAQATLWLGRVHERRGDFERAAAEYRKALEISRVNRDRMLTDQSSFSVAGVLTKMGRLEEGVITNLDSLLETIQLGERGDPRPNLQLLAAQQDLTGADRLKVLLRERLESELAASVLKALDQYREMTGSMQDSV